MPAGVYNMTIEAGATFQQDFIWKISATPVNVAGYSARMMVRPTVLSVGAPLSSWDTNNGRLTVGTIDGKISIFLRDIDTDLMVGGVYDLELVSPAATPVVTRLLKGTITIDPQVTR